MIIMFRTFCLLALEDFQIIWLSNHWLWAHMTKIIPEMRSCALNALSKFLFLRNFSNIFYLCVRDIEFVSCYDFGIVPTAGYFLFFYFIHISWWNFLSNMIEQFEYNKFTCSIQNTRHGNLAYICIWCNFIVTPLVDRQHSLKIPKL